MNAQAQQLASRTVSRTGVNLIKIATGYMICGLGLGLFMGISHDFALMSVHTHVLLLGWVTMAISGVVYVIFPGCQESRLAKLHFWGLNVALPIMIGGLISATYGHAIGDKVLGSASMFLFVSMLAFVVNVFRNAGARVAERGSQTASELLQQEEIDVVRS